METAISEFLKWFGWMFVPFIFWGLWKLFWVTADNTGLIASAETYRKEQAARLAAKHVKRPN